MRLLTRSDVDNDKTGAIRRVFSGMDRVQIISAASIYFSHSAVTASLAPKPFHGPAHLILRRDHSGLHRSDVIAGPMQGDALFRLRRNLHEQQEPDFQLTVSAMPAHPLYQRTTQQWFPMRSTRWPRAAYRRHAHQQAQRLHLRASRRRSARE